MRGSCNEPAGCLVSSLTSMIESHRTRLLGNSPQAEMRDWKPEGGLLTTVLSHTFCADRTAQDWTT